MTRFDRAGGLERERERAADQADAEDDYRIEAGPCHALALQHRFQRLEEARILLAPGRWSRAGGRACRSPANGRTITPWLQQLLEHRARLALARRPRARDFDSDEIGVRGNPGQAQPLASGQQLRHAGDVELVALAQEVLVVSAATAAASARLLTLNGWRTRFIMSATSAWHTA